MRRVPYLPFLDGPPDFAPRLKPLDPARWLLPDPEVERWLPEKREIMRHRRAEVFGGNEGAGGEETLAMVAGYLGVPKPSGWPTPLEAAASLVSDDFCLVRRHDGAPWTLAAASLCAPTYWRLAPMLNRSLSGLHGAVPGGDPDLAARIGRVFDGLAPEHLLERFNWTVQRGDARFTPVRPTEGRDLYLRVERQTIRKLPRTEEVLFTIRITIDPLTALLTDRRTRDAFATAWQEAPADVRSYKAWDTLDEEVTALIAAYA